MTDAIGVGAGGGDEAVEDAEESKSVEKCCDESDGEGEGDKDGK